MVPIWLRTTGAKASGCEADRSAEVRNRWSFTTTKPYVVLFLRLSTGTCLDSYLCGAKSVSRRYHLLSSRDILKGLWKPKLRYPAHNSSLLIHFQNQIHPFQTLTLQSGKLLPALVSTGILASESRVTHRHILRSHVTGSWAV